MPKSISPLPMSLEQRHTLEARIRAHNTPQSIALLAADDLSSVRVAREAGVSRPTVILWRKCFLQGGNEAIATILPGRGCPVAYTTEQVQRIVEATTQTKPPGATHSGEEIQALQ